MIWKILVHWIMEILQTVMQKSYSLTSPTILLEKSLYTEKHQLSVLMVGSTGFLKSQLLLVNLNFIICNKFCQLISLKSPVQLSSILKMSGSYPSLNNIVHLSVILLSKDGVPWKNLKKLETQSRKCFPWDTTTLQYSAQVLSVLPFGHRDY